MDDALSRAEHIEFAKRMEEEHTRQRERMDAFEKVLGENNKLIVSIEKLALSVENMQKEIRDQGTRLDKIEARDGEMWRKVVGHVITVVIGLVIGYMSTLIGM